MLNALGLLLSLLFLPYYIIRFLLALLGIGAHLLTTDTRRSETITYRDGKEVGSTETIRRANGSVTRAIKNGVEIIKVTKK